MTRMKIYRKDTKVAKERRGIKLERGIYSARMPSVIQNSKFKIQPSKFLPLPLRLLCDLRAFAVHSSNLPTEKPNT